MTERVQCQRLQVAAELKQFIESEVLPGSGIEANTFWSGFDALVHDLAPRNRALLAGADYVAAGAPSGSDNNNRAAAGGH